MMLMVNVSLVKAIEKNEFFPFKRIIIAGVAWILAGFGFHWPVNLLLSKIIDR
jgi:hypothetical protein